MKKLVIASDVEKSKMVLGDIVLSPENQAKIEEYVKSHPGLDDTEFHNFVQSLGIDPHEAEEVVYQYVQKLLKKGSRRTSEGEGEGGGEAPPEWLNKIDDIVYFLQTAKTNLSGAKGSSAKDGQQYLLRAKKVLDLVAQNLLPKNIGG